MNARLLKVGGVSAKLLCIQLPIAVLAVLILFALMEVHFYQGERARLTVELSRTLASQSAAVEAAVWGLDVEGLQKILDDQVRLAMVQAAEVLDENGEVLASSGDTRLAPSSPEFRKELVLVHEASTGTQEIGRFIVTVSDDGIRNALFQHLKTNGAILLVLVVALVAGTIYAARLVVGRPLDQFSRAIARSPEEQIERPLAWRRKDELGEMLNAYNEMLTARHAAEDALRIVNLDLEQRVEARTHALERSEAQFKAVVDQLPSGIMLKDIEGGVLFVNEQERQWLAADSPFDVLGAYIGDLFQPGTAAELIELNGKAASGAVVREREMSIDWPDGQRREMLVTKFPINDESGALIAVGSVLTDITLVRAAEQRLLSILEASPVAAVVLGTKDRRILFSNAHSTELLGINAVETRTAHDFYANPEDRDEIMRRYEADGEVRNAEVRMRSRDGTNLWVLLSILPFRSPGEPAHLAWIYDITERKAAEEEVSRQQRLLDQVLSTIVQGVVKYDSKRRLELWNDQYRACLSLPKELMSAGRPMRELATVVAQRGDYGDGEIDEMVEHRLSQLSSGKSGRSEVLVGGETAFDVMWQPTDDDGVVITYTDISDRKNAEAQVRRALTTIQESVDYASYIQRSILPRTPNLSAVMADHFVIWEPRDSVGGDMYWFKQDRQGYYLALFDCTGHGVPGALMTTLSVSALNIAFAETAEPARLLFRANQLVKEMLGQDGEDGMSDDGFEIGLCLVEPERMRLTYAGARFELLCATGADIETIKGDKTGIGYRRVPYDQAFTSHSIRLRRGQRFYMFSDGVTDQVGGEKRRAFGRTRLTRILQREANRGMCEQKDIILREFAAYQGEQLRRDDVSMVGFKPVG